MQGGATDGMWIRGERFHGSVCLCVCVCVCVEGVREGGIVVPDTTVRHPSQLSLSVCLLLQLCFFPSKLLSCKSDCKFLVMYENISLAPAPPL